MERTIVMIHGMMVGPWCWENYKGFFEGKGYRCVTPVLRFHDMDPGDPPDPRLGTVGLLDYAADLEKELREMAVPPILMGHSMGGLLVQILASRGLARAAVLLTPASPRGVMALKPSVIRSFSDVMMRWGFWKRPFRFSFEKAVYSTMHLMPRQQQEDAYRRMVYESGRAAFEIGLWLLDSGRASEVDPRKVTCPVLVVAGRHDRITPASVVRQVAARYEAVSTFKEFGGHAHWVLIEPGWEEVAQYVHDWLDRVLGEG